MYCVLRDCSANQQLKRQVVELVDIIKESINSHPNARPLAFVHEGPRQRGEERATGCTDNIDVESVASSGRRPRAKARPRQGVHVAHGVMFIVRYDRGQDLTETVKHRRGDNSVCGEDISQVGLSSNDEVVRCIQRNTSHRDIVIPQRGDRRLYQFVDDRNRNEGYTNAGYTCISDGVAGSIIEKIHYGGTQFCHPKWNIVDKAEPMSFYDRDQPVRCFQKDLRHGVGKIPGSYKVGRLPVPTIPCDEAGWVRLDKLLNMDVLSSHDSRRLDVPLHAHDAEERQRQLNQRLQMLFDGNRINFFETSKIRLQFLGIRVAEPPNPEDVVREAEPFDRRMVTVATQREELRRNQNSSSSIRRICIIPTVGKDHGPSGRHVVIPITSTTRSWKSTRQSLHCRSPTRSSIRSRVRVMQQSTTTSNPSWKTVSKQVGISLGTTASYSGVYTVTGRGFPPWDQRNQVTRIRSSVERCIRLVTLYVPILDIIREGKVTESGVIICSRTIPFRLVKELWVCLPDVKHHRSFEYVEKILDYELEDEFCPEYIRSPVAKSMRSYRALERLMGLLCDMPSGPHDAARQEYVSRLADYCGVPWDNVDWERYENLYKEVTDFLLLHTLPSRHARTSRDTELQFRYGPWCLESVPSCLARCAQFFSVFISFVQESENRMSL